MTLTKEEYHRDFALKVIDLLKRDLAPWTQPWQPGELVPPRNIITGRAYTGGNVVRCWVEAALRGFADQRWGTYRQFKEIGGQVRKGERSIHLLRPISGKKTNKVKQDERGQTSMFDGAEPVRTHNNKKKDKPSKPEASGDKLLADDDASDEYFLRYFQSFPVFNSEQADGVPEPKEWQRQEEGRERT